MIKKHVLHKRSKEIGKVPSETDIEYGEIAINYLKDNETLSIKNSSNEIITLPFKGGAVNDDYVAKSGDTMTGNLNIEANINIGTENTATGQYAFAQGNMCSASGLYSHAEGSRTNAKGDTSHAEGRNCQAISDSSHAEGANTIANGGQSHAEGMETEANGDYSHAEGGGTRANNLAEHASGFQNLSIEGASQNLTALTADTQATLFSVGNGIDDNNRRNAFEIKWNGDTYINKKLTVPELVSPTLDALKQYVDDFVLTLMDILGIGLKYTGHADVEGLKAIGWTNTDILYYQIHGVNWNKEADVSHKVPQENIDLYGVINATNIQQYKDSLFYLPKIDTSAITDFSKMFMNCTSLVGIPMIDTSNGTDFGGGNGFAMFYGCNSLTSIPLLDVSKGTDFESMFDNCVSLMSIPLLNTSNGTNFDGMFRNCYSLTTIPLLDTSNGTNFSYMFYNCPKLTSIPLLDTSNGTNFSYMFYNCTSLIKILKLDLSNGTNFREMFKNCYSLIEILELKFGNTGNGYFYGMFDGCKSLTTIPMIDISNGTDFYQMFRNCSSLVSIPMIDTSNGMQFGEMFYNCTSLTSIPLLDVSNATKWNNFSGVFYNCSILSELNLKGLPLSIELQDINQVTINKESILFIINNSIATSNITIKLDANNYGIYSVDADVIAALALKPFVTLIQ